MESIADKITVKRYREVANVLLDWYGLLVIDTDVYLSIKGRDDIALEIRDNTYTDTVIRERIADLVCIYKIGMKMPMYGDTEQYKTKFHVVAKEASIIK